MLRRHVTIAAVIVSAVAVSVADVASDVWSEYPMIASFVSGGITILFTVLVVDEVLRRRESRRTELVLAHHAELLAEETNRVERTAKVSAKRADRDELAAAEGAILQYRMLLLSLSATMAVDDRGLEALEAARACCQELERVVHDDADNSHFGKPPENRELLWALRRSVHRRAWPIYGGYLADDKRRDRLFNPDFAREYVLGE